MAHGLLWLGRNAGRFHAIGWLLIVGAILVSCSVSTDAGDWTFRYPPDLLISRFGRVLLSVAVLCSLIALVIWRRWRTLLALLISGVLLAIFPPRSPFNDGSLSSVCSEEGKCYYLTIAPVFGDTVYDVWQASWASSLIWRRVQIDDQLNYSEDGSYLSNPYLTLSANSRILVVARGGYLVDAIDLQTTQRLSEFISWNEPDRDDRMRANSDRIRILLEENR